ncbi:MAG: GPW/gp25 family protein [bacterium]
MSIKPINIEFPLRDDNDTNVFFRKNRLTKEALKSSLILLLTTEKGQRYYKPDFGIDLRKYIFEPNVETTRDKVLQEIKTEVKKYVPQLTVRDVEFNGSENEMLLTIYFTYSDQVFSQPDNVTLSFVGTQPNQ